MYQYRAMVTNRGAAMTQMLRHYRSGDNICSCTWHRVGWSMPMVNESHDMHRGIESVARSQYTSDTSSLHAIQSTSSRQKKSTLRKETPASTRLSSSQVFACLTGHPGPDQTSLSPAQRRPTQASAVPGHPPRLLARALARDSPLSPLLAPIVLRAPSPSPAEPEPGAAWHRRSYSW